MMHTTPAHSIGPCPVSRPTIAMTPQKPIASPATRDAPRRSLTPNSGAMRTTLNGTVAIRMPASDELIHCSPIAISENGTTSSATAKAVTAVLCANAFCSEPRCHAIGTSTMAASVMRPHATHTGDSSCRASLMKK